MSKTVKNFPILLAALTLVIGLCSSCIKQTGNSDISLPSPSASISTAVSGPAQTPEPAPSPEPVVAYDPIIDFYRIPFELGKPQYSVDEIQKMISDNLTLDEVADKVSTLADVVQYLHQKNFGLASGDIYFTVDNVGWAVNRSAQVVFDENKGNCGGSSNLINYLLREDFDEQGYVAEAANNGGHIYNYFKQDNMYYFFDFIKVIYDGSYNNDRYFVNAAKNPQEYSDYHVFLDHKHNSEEDPMYIWLQYMYPYEGCHRPVSCNQNLILQSAFCNILSQEIEEVITVLYIGEPRFAPIFQSAPSENLWPREAQ